MFRTCCAPIILLLSVLLFSACRTEVSPPPPEEIRLRLAGDPDAIHPLLARNGYSWQLIEQIFQPLRQFDPESLELAPVLVTGPPERRDWTEGAYKEGIALTYEIRKEARWDNGSPILASDYAFTLKCIFNPLIPNGFWGYLDFIKALEIDEDNPRRFTVFCDRPYFLAEVASSNFEIYPEYAYDADSLLHNFDIAQFLVAEEREKLKTVAAIDSFAQHFRAAKYSHDPSLIEGSGPYELKEWIPGQSLVLEKKKDWWGNGLADSMLVANADRMRYSVVPDITAAISLFKGEQLDVLADIPGRQFAEFQDASLLKDRYDWHQPAQLLYYYIALNRKNPKLEDQRVRRALAHVLDLPKIIEQVMYGFAETTIGPFSPQSPYYRSDLQPISFDLERAGQLLAAAGWSDTNGNGVVDKRINGVLQELNLQLDVSTGSATGKQVGLIFQENARKVGIAVELRLMEFSQLSASLRKEDFEMSYSARGARPGESDPTQDWYADKSKGGISNYSNFGNATSDALIDALRSSADQSERFEYYRQLQEMIYEDQAVLFVFIPRNRIAIDKKYSASVSQRRPGYFPERFKLKKTTH